MCGHPLSSASPVVHRGRFLFPVQACLGETHRRLRRNFGWHVRPQVVSRRHRRQAAADSLIAYLHPMTESAPKTARARIAPAGLGFLAITSIGWGIAWPVTKYLLAEVPPLTLRGSTGVIGAILLAALAL